LLCATDESQELGATFSELGSPSAVLDRSSLVAAILGLGSSRAVGAGICAL
jgi:hypothetical protein